METIEKVTIEITISEKIIIQDALQQHAKNLMWKVHDSIGESQEEKSKRDFWRKRARMLDEIEKKFR